MKKRQAGFTLVELIVVVAILGVLAAMLLPKFDGIQKAADHAAAASSTADIAKLIDSYFVAKTVYPNSWDSLLNGTALWNAASVGNSTLGLDPELTGSGTTVDKIIVGPALQANQVTAMANVGITKVMTVNTTSGLVSRPGDMFLTPVPIATGLTLATINAGSPGGIKIINHIYRSNLQTGSTLSGTINPTSTISGDTQLVVFGIGPQNSMVGNSIMEPPTYGEVNGQFVYNRLLAVFEVTGFSSATASSKITFKAVLGADGDLLDDMAAGVQNANL